MTRPRSAVAPTAAPRRVRGLPGLDGLRGLCALCVLTAHVAARWSPDLTARTHLGLLALAVFVFLVMSGLLIYRPFATALLRGAPLPSTAEYTRHRVLRIFPAYLLIFAVAWLAGALYVDNAAQHDATYSTAGTGRITDPLLLLGNLTLTQSLVPGGLQTGINPSWSLTVELCFYAVVPLLAAGTVLLRRRSGPSLLPAVLPAVVLIVLGLAGRGLAAVLAERSGASTALLDWGPTWVAVIGISLLGLGDVFAFGMLAGLVVLRSADRPALAARARALALIALVPTVLLTLVLLVAGSSLAVSMLGLFASALVLVVVLPTRAGRPGVVARLLELRPVVWLGTVSLSVYLWHYPVLVVAGREGWLVRDSGLGLAWNLGLVTLVTLVLSWASYTVVERPGQRLARRLPVLPRGSPLGARRVSARGRADS